MKTVNGVIDVINRTGNNSSTKGCTRAIKNGTRYTKHTYETKTDSSGNVYRCCSNCGVVHFKTTQE